MRNIEDILQGINIGIAVGLALSKNKKDTLELYKEIMRNSILPDGELTQDYTNYLKSHAKSDFQERKYNDAVLKYLDVFRCTELEPDEYLNAGICLIELGQLSAGEEFLSRYEKNFQNQLIAQKTLGEIYFKRFNDYEKAIYHYEKFISLCKLDDEVYNILGHLYSLYYKDKFLEKQYEYFYVAYNLKKNTRVYIRNIIFALFRLGRYDEVEEYYQKLLKLQPSHADYYYYGCFLINQKHFKEGYKYLQHRFEKEGNDKSIIPAVLNMNKYWHGEDLTRKKILVHCEQGFGDSIMYARFIKILAKKAQKVYFVVQNDLFELMNKSNLGAEIYSTKFELCRLDYDYYTTTVDLPLYLNIDPADLPFRTGYLWAPPANIGGNNYKIGICYQGSSASKESARDIPPDNFYPLLSLKNTSIYSLQVGSNVSLPPDIIDLGKDFKDFNDTARAIMAMDIIISTDNAVLNLAGALGKPAMGLFNRFVEYRWYDLEDGKPSNWYSSIKVFQNKEQDNWCSVISRVVAEIRLNYPNANV